MKKLMKKTSTELPAKLMIFACVIFALTWALAAMSWLTDGSFPHELKDYVMWFWGIALTIYTATHCVEYVTDHKAPENKEENTNGILNP